MEFSKQDIADYYNTTQTHYETWWKLKETHALHYGIWGPKTKNFKEALINTNKTIAEHAKIKEGSKILDAGCGVGGTAFYLNRNYKAKVNGISLSEKQLDTAQELLGKLNNSSDISFHMMDYHQTDFEDNSFDVVWACESMCHSHNKELFLEECYRILKKGGRLVIADYFNNPEKKDTNQYIQKWIKTWSVPSIMNEMNIRSLSEKLKYNQFESFDYTSEVKKSAKKMYMYAILAAIPSEIYNFFNPKVSRFAKTHYKCGIYQYKSFVKKLWFYKIVVITK